MTDNSSVHDPAFHVANAYHTNAGQSCESCGQPWPCVTITNFNITQEVG